MGQSSARIDLATARVTDDATDNHGHTKAALDRLEALRRPRLLIQAARIGAQDYRRDIHLYRHLGTRPLPRPGAALTDLLTREADMNDRRRRNDAVYSVMDHVDILIAMMGEARLLRAAHPAQAQPNASGIKAFFSAT